MENQFEKVMSKRTDKELIKIVTVERGNYMPLAIEAAELEIEKRNLDTSYIKKTKQKASTENELQQKEDSNLVDPEIRFVHYLVDSIVCYIFIIIIFSIIISVIAGLLAPQTNEATKILILFILFILLLAIQFGYYFLLETKYQKTLGKFLTKSRVINNDGGIPTKNEIMIRTFC